MERSLTTPSSTIEITGISGSGILFKIAQTSSVVGSTCVSDIFDDLLRNYTNPALFNNAFTLGFLPLKRSYKTSGCSLPPLLKTLS